MDAKLQRLDHAVATVADAWLADPTDHRLYARLVDAIAERRAYLHPAIDQMLEPDVPPATQPDEILDELEHTNPPVSIGEAIRHQAASERPDER